MTFVAWQDQPPEHVRAEARELAQAATWLSCHRLTWATADRDVWMDYCQDIAWEPPPGEPVFHRAYRAVATLHRAYGFWHWWEPRRIPRQPFPGWLEERREWVQQAIALLPRSPEYFIP